MIILAGDLATQSGFCLGRPADTPAVRTCRAPSTGKEYGPWAAFYFRYFWALLEEVHVAAEPGEKILVAYEAPILPEKKWDKDLKRMVGGTSLETTRKLHALGPILEAVCTMYADLNDLAIEVSEVNVSTVKKELTGHGHAPKAEMVRVARACGIALPEGSEEQDGADGFGVWLYAVRMRATAAESAAWDRRIHGRSAPQERVSAAQARLLLARR